MVASWTRARRFPPGPPGSIIEACFSPRRCRRVSAQASSEMHTRSRTLSGTLRRASEVRPLLV